jgi:hypothetical protein
MGHSSSECNYFLPRLFSCRQAAVLRLKGLNRPWRGVVTGDGWKLAVLENQHWMLHNLRDDPYEQVNLAFNSKFYADRRRLMGLLREWLDETGDSFPLPED